jgi:hypothetical protein
MPVAFYCYLCFSQLLLGVEDTRGTFAAYIQYNTTVFRVGHCPLDQGGGAIRQNNLVIWTPTLDASIAIASSDQAAALSNHGLLIHTQQM